MPTRSFHVPRRVSLATALLLGAVSLLFGILLTGLVLRSFVAHQRAAGATRAGTGIVAPVAPAASPPAVKRAASTMKREPIATPVVSSSAKRVPKRLKPTLVKPRSVSASWKAVWNSGKGNTKSHNKHKTKKHKPGNPAKPGKRGPGIRHGNGHGNGHGKGHKNGHGHKNG